MLATRRVEPEWLDELAPDDPQAMAARRDLRRINAWMMHGRIVTKMLLSDPAVRPPRAILDLGGGDGAFALALARRLAPRWPDVHLTVLDRHALLGDQTRESLTLLGWRPETVASDVFAFLDRPHRAFDLVIANLFLHHFPSHRLSRLLALISRATHRVVACEPRRSPVALLASRLLWMIGCNGVSRHDARVSVMAGFRGKEISAEWRGIGPWSLNEGPAGLFSHVFAAHRSESEP
jgi:hypothetical protein